MRKYWHIPDSSPLAVAFEETCPDGFVEVTDTDTIKTLHEQRYVRITQDGWTYYNSFRTDIYIKIITGQITQQQGFDFELHTHDIQQALMSGNWITALNVNATLPLSGIYDQATKDKLNLDFSTYVSENY